MVYWQFNDATIQADIFLQYKNFGIVNLIIQWINIMITKKRKKYNIDKNIKNKKYLF